MKRFDVSAFSRYCAENRVSSFIFSSINQKKSSYPLSAELYFSSMDIELCPNCLYFYGNTDKMCIFGVKEIVVDGFAGVRSRATITCLDENGNRVEYIILLVKFK